MATTDEARHRLYQELERVLGQEHAATLMSQLPPWGWGEIATHRDVDMLGRELRAEMAELGSALRSEMAELGSALRSEMAELRGELRSEMAELGSELRSEMAELRGELRSEMAELRGELRSDMSNLRADVAEKLRSQTLVIVGSNVGLAAALLGAARLIS